MVNIQCKTNIDSAKLLQWPNKLPEQPMIGDIIRSQSSTNKKYFELEVVQRTWVFSPLFQEWTLNLELHLPKHFQSIADFDRFVKEM